MFPRRDMEAEELQKAEAQKEIHEKLFLRALVVLKCSLWIFWDLFDTLTKQIKFLKVSNTKRKRSQEFTFAYCMY